MKNKKSEHKKKEEKSVKKTRENKHTKEHERVAPKKGADSKVEKVMHEFKEGKLHSGSKKGPEVTNPKQAIAIALSEQRKAKKRK